MAGLENGNKYFFCCMWRLQYWVGGRCLYFIIFSCTLFIIASTTIILYVNSCLVKIYRMIVINGVLFIFFQVNCVVLVILPSHTSELYC